MEKTEVSQPEPSHKIATLPTAISLAGGLLVMNGLRRGIDTPLGFAETFTGKMFDLADGWAARKFGDTKTGHKVASIIGDDRIGESYPGAVIDPVLDRVTNLSIMVEAWRNEMAPKPVIATLVGLEAIKSTASVIDYIRHAETRETRKPTKAGKIGVALGVAALGLFFTEKFVPQDNNTKNYLKTAAYTSFAFGALLNASAGKHYINRARGKE